MSIILHLEELRNSALSSSMECNIFRAAALDTWYRIGFSRTRPRLRIHETTITQNLVYELNLLKAVMPRLGFKIFESINEKANGDDLEIKIKDSSGQYITFAAQAKILYHNFPPMKGGVKNLGDGRYKTMQHYVGKKRLNQIDLLLDYARKKKQIPIYLLYNYVDKHFTEELKCGVPFSQEQYGCSVISTHYLKNTFKRSDGNLPKTIKFSDLHPYIAKPWFVLSCCFSKMGINDIVKELGSAELDYEIQKEFEGSVVDDPNWRLMTETFNPFFRDSNFSQISAGNNFNPMFRIVLDKLDII